MPFSVQLKDTTLVPLPHTGEPPVVHGDGLQSRDFSFISDVVDANLVAHATGSATLLPPTDEHAA